MPEKNPTEFHGKKEVDDRVQGSDQTDTFHRCGIWKRKKTDQNFYPWLKWCFFFTPSCEQQGLALIVFSLWGKLGQSYNQVL